VEYNAAHNSEFEIQFAWRGEMWSPDTQPMPTQGLAFVSFTSALFFVHRWLIFTLIDFDFSWPAEVSREEIVSSDSAWLTDVIEVHFDSIGFPRLTNLAAFLLRATEPDCLFSFSFPFLFFASLSIFRSQMISQFVSRRLRDPLTSVSGQPWPEIRVSFLSARETNSKESVLSFIILLLAF